MDILTKVTEALENMDSEELIILHNNYCDENNYIDDYINDMCMFDELESGRRPSEVLNDISDDFNINDNYFVCGVYGYTSFDYADDPGSPVYISDIARYIVNNMDDLGNDDIKEILETEEEEDGDE